ncbi:MBOAT family O-acyltransferase [Pedobacter psychrodurus]|uniref:MBOAT family O-acyltransferase n=1 Tax=Pedobacter psychrodurus TaxID=2530456 RepID=UPI00292FFF1A|nr:MBOAT family O-acyltransferase [Pedobacter psychrodurus]
MLFNSISFACFLPIVFLLYWFIFNKSLKFQNILLLTASYFFYSCWDWRFLFLLAFSTLLDFYSGLAIQSSKSQYQRKFWLLLSVVINLGFLAYFKYYNFFVESFADLMSKSGFQANVVTLKIILPVGISFYTFHGLSYVFDIYNRKITPTTNFVQYSLFVSFFPLLVAGPIERATHLLPQMENARKFSYAQAVNGLRQILWGFLKKVVIADSCAEFANMIFNNSGEYSGSALVLGAIFFAFQIYGDFSGYSDIALGVARLFGFELLKNFSFPYFSRDIAEFWRRWHISLSSWFRDYLYYPLGGSRGNTFLRVRNTFIIFLVSGFWHGANWTFLIWGALNALFIMPSIIFKTNRDNLEIVAKGKILPSVKSFCQMLITFGLTVFAWIFFRAKDLQHALSYIKGIFNKSLFSLPTSGHPELNRSLLCLLLVFAFMTIEWFGREDNFALEKLGISWPKPMRLLFYSVLIFCLGMFMQSGETAFIYFQF